MHVEVNVALNFLISYLYNKLPRRRVDLFGDELEKGLKQKFEGHWYPDKPFKGSGYRCLRCNGDKVDPLIMKAVRSAGLDLGEVKNYIPEEMTLWIDPSEVSYRISEKSPIKVLYTDRHEDEVCDTTDREVQAANHTFNPEALSFQPIDSLPSSLGSLSLSPSSPLQPGVWGASASPSAALSSSSSPSSSALLFPSPSSSALHFPSPSSSALLFPSPSSSALNFPSPVQPMPPHPPTTLQLPQAGPAPLPSTGPVFMGKTSAMPQFTAATFAATKFGSTKLKSQAKRPTRLSPTELGNYFRNQQHQQQQQPQRVAGFGTTPSPQRPGSLSPRDPRLEFLIDQQQRWYTHGQLSPQGHQSLNYTLQQQQQQQQHMHQQQQFATLFPSSQGQASPGGGFPPYALGDLAPRQSPSYGNGGAWGPTFPDMPSPSSTTPSSLHSPATSLSPEGHKTFLEDLQQMGGVHAYPGQRQHLLVAN